MLKARTRERIKKIALPIGGLLVGGINGLFGGGGGMLLVPLLTFIGGLEQKESHATAIAIILPLCVVTAITYTLFGKIALLSAGFTELGVIIGGIIGAIFLKKISSKLLSVFFYVLMIVAGVRMLI